MIINGIKLSLAMIAKFIFHFVYKYFINLLINCINIQPDSAIKDMCVVIYLFALILVFIVDTSFMYLVFSDIFDE